MIYRFKIKKNEYRNSKLLFCSPWFEATDITEAITKKDDFIATHPEYKGYWIDWDSRRTKENSNKSVLTAEQVIEIKQALADGIPGISYSRTGGYLAKKYGVSRQTINDIKWGKTHQNV